MHHFFDYIKYSNDANVSTLFLGHLQRNELKEKIAMEQDNMNFPVLIKSIEVE